jgi:nicotinamide phosphoribosyltransferase
MQKLNKTFKINPLYEADSYKVGHKEMMAEGATREYWTWIPRNLKYMPGEIDKIMSAGQQLVVRYLHSNFKEFFFDQPIEVAIKFGEDMCKHIGKPYNYQHFVDLHKLGYLPIKIKALPEGILTDKNIPHMTGINTLDGYAWLGLYLETLISKTAWQCPTSATIGHKFKSNAIEWVKKTDEKNLWLANHMCHDFHSRGGNPFTSIAVGLGHAMSNLGSDTLNVIPASRYYYDFDEKEVPIFSVTASEHSVSCTKIFTVGEKQMIIDWLKQNPTGILSIVADTFDLWKLITEYLADPEVKALIMARDGKLVIRPDSGDPVDIICGISSKYENLSEYFPEGDVLPEYFEDSLLEEVRENTPHGEHGDIEHENTYIVRGKLYKAKIHNISWNRHDKQYYFIDMYEKAKITVEEIDWKSSDKGVIELLYDIFGGTINDQGYKVLDSHIGAIYGDSINLERQISIYTRLANKRFAATNIVLGVGSYTYVMLTRDSAGYAAKGAWFEVEEEIAGNYVAAGSEFQKKAYNIYKEPITDDGSKKSLKGLIRVFVTEDFQIKVQEECTFEQENMSLLQTIYEDGKFYNQTTLTEIRDRLKL